MDDAKVMGLTWQSNDINIWKVFSAVVTEPKTYARPKQQPEYFVVKNHGKKTTMLWNIQQNGFIVCDVSLGW